MKQGEDDLYFVLDRNTNKTKLIRGNINFVNNHFWNCYENQIGDIVIEAVAATDEYLDTYFDRNLARGHPTWSDMFHPPIRCHLSFAEATANCVPMFQQLKKDAGESWNPTNVLFDYPTFNPHYKMDSSYRYFYAIGITSNTSGWFDRVIKVDVRTDTITHAWSSPDVYLTEFDFVPAHSSEEGGKNEDNGVLISIVYNKTSDMSFFTMLNATNLQLLGMYPMEHAVPFHAHGIVCKSGVPCFTNP
jgi:carotenoid cleavage dioxygenase-like enzyme